VAVSPLNTSSTRHCLHLEIPPPLPIPMFKNHPLLLSSPPLLLLDIPPRTTICGFSDFLGPLFLHSLPFLFSFLLSFFLIFILPEILRLLSIPKFLRILAVLKSSAPRLLFSPDRFPSLPSLGGRFFPFEPQLRFEEMAFFTSPRNFSFTSPLVPFSPPPPAPFPMVFFPPAQNVWITRPFFSLLQVLAL